MCPKIDQDNSFFGLLGLLINYFILFYFLLNCLSSIQTVYEHFAFFFLLGAVAIFFLAHFFGRFVFVFSLIPLFGTHFFSFYHIFILEKKMCFARFFDQLLNRKLFINNNAQLSLTMCAICLVCYEWLGI